MRKNLFNSANKLALLILCLSITKSQATIQRMAGGPGGVTIASDLKALPATTAKTNAEKQIKIVKATYGAGNVVVDVTEKLQARIPAGVASFTLSKDNVGVDKYGSWPNVIFGDPAFGKDKTLNVTFQGADGIQLTASTNEKDPLVLALASSAVSKKVLYLGDTITLENVTFSGKFLVDDGGRSKLATINNPTFAQWILERSPEENGNEIKAGTFPKLKNVGTGKYLGLIRAYGGDKFNPMVDNANGEYWAIIDLDANYAHEIDAMASALIKKWDYTRMYAELNKRGEKSPVNDKAKVALFSNTSGRFLHVTESDQKPVNTFTSIMDKNDHETNKNIWIIHLINSPTANAMAAAEKAKEKEEAEAAAKAAEEAKEAKEKEEAAAKAAEEAKEAKEKEEALQVELNAEGFMLEPGIFKKISVGIKDNKLEAWALDANGVAYRYDACAGHPYKMSSLATVNPWVKKDLTVNLTDISVSSNGSMLAIRDGKTVVKYDWTKNTWIVLPATNQDTIKLVNITIADDSNIYALSQDSVIYKYDAKKTEASWEKVSDGKAVATGMSTDKKLILIKIGKDDKAYELVGNKWAELTGADNLIDVTVGNERHIFALDKNGSLWKLHHEEKNWVPVNAKNGKQIGGFSSISVNAKGTLFALDGDGENYHKRFGKAPIAIAGEKQTRSQAVAAGKTKAKAIKAGKKVIIKKKTTKKIAAKKTVTKPTSERLSRKKARAALIEQAKAATATASKTSPAAK